MNKLIVLMGLLVGAHVAKAQDTVSVLFIGNSFTFMNEMPLMFKEIAKSKGKTVHVEHHT
jgi:hypothetical protein